jgi:acetyl-CoA C-acetyltransferase
VPEAFIVDAVRTPIGKFRGALSGWHPVDLAAHTLTALVGRTGIDPGVIDDVIMGCVDQIGAQAMNIARNAWLSTGYPQGVPGVTVDRQCGSSHQALSFASQAIKAGDADLVIACGVEAMSRVPMLSAIYEGERAGYGHPWNGEGWRARFADEEVSQFRGAELIADRWSLSRERLEEYAVRSHALAGAAWDGGLFDAEVVPTGDLGRDEGIRPGTSLENLATLQPLREGGRLTAGTSSQLSDASAAVLVASERAVEEYGLTPLVRVRSSVVVGSDPIEMLSGPIPATRKVLERSGLSVSDVGLFEINEAFAPVVLAWEDDLKVDADRVNVKGGAIAIGHPLGATGARIAATLVHEMVRTGTELGLQTICEGAGTANATIFELV